MRNAAASLGLATTILVSVACGSSSNTAAVFGASSLTELLRELGDAFEREDGGASVRFSFASSSALATQIRQGAPAEVYASANPALAVSLTEDGYVQTSRVVATTRMIVVARRDDGSVDSLSDLANPDVILVLASGGVPAGDYARDVLAKASMPGVLGEDFRERVLSNVRSFEPNVRAALLKVELGEADAAIVYATDVPPNSTRLRSIEIPDEYNVVATFSVSLLNEAGGPARRFFDFLATKEAADIVERLGFGALRSPD